MNELKRKVTNNKPFENIDNLGRPTVMGALLSNMLAIRPSQEGVIKDWDNKDKAMGSKVQQSFLK